MDDIHTCAGVVELDKEGTLLVRIFNDQFLRMIGPGVANTVDGQILLDALPETAASSLLSKKLHGCFSAGKSQDSEQIYDHDKEGEYWRLTLAIIWPDGETSSPTHVVVTGFKVRERRNYEEEKSSTHAARYEAIVSLAYDAIVAMDQNRRITLFNQAAENLFGYSEDEVIGRPVEILLPENLRATHPQKVRDFSDSYQPRQRRATAPRMDGTNSVFGRHRDGTLIPIEVAVSKISMSGKTEFIAVVRDISDRARLIDLLKKEATTDMLTGLPNRRQFIEFLKTKFGGDGNFSVFILDVDFFKIINDQHGHDAGDEVLRLIATVGGAMLGGQNLFARWGGEEFVAALPGADADMAYKIADALRQRCENQDFHHEWRRGPIAFTVSIGVAARHKSDVDISGVMTRADSALYRAKGSGRNRVEVG